MEDSIENTYLGIFWKLCTISIFGLPSGLSKICLPQVFSHVFNYCQSADVQHNILTLMHSEWPKLYWVLAILSAIGLKNAQTNILCGLE